MYLNAIRSYLHFCKFYKYTAAADVSVCVCVCVCYGDTEGRLSAQIRWCWDTHGKQVNDPWAWLPAFRSKILKASRGMDKEDVLPIYNGILLSHKENKIMPCATIWVEPEIVIQSEVSQRERQILFNISCMWNLKWTYLQNRNRVTDVENKLAVTGGKGGEG